ncbi:MAG TPA: glycosyltransferase family 87 protein [Acidimicrobiales bacterium]|nr:glycosyltransferase family 87 protein [Acidimicrobiales bacterium]
MAVAAVVGALDLRGVTPQDLGAFLHGGSRLLAGADPYSPVASPLFRSGHAFVYPVVAGWVLAPLSLLDRAVADGVFAAVSVVAILASCALFGHRRPLEPALILAASATVIALQMGTLNALLLLGLAVAWAGRDRAWMAGLAVAAVIVAKLFLLPALAWLVLTRRWRAAGVALIATALALGAGFALGPLSLHQYSSMLSVLSRREAAEGWSLTGLAVNLGLPSTAAQGVAVVAGVGLLGAAAWQQRRHTDERIVFAAAVVAALLVTPILWSSYLVLLAAPLLLLSRRPVPLAVGCVVSWILVIPDQVSTALVLAGLAVAAVVVVAAAVVPVASGSPPRPLTSLVPRGRRPSTPELLVATGAVVALALASPVVRSQLACVLAVLAAGAWALDLWPRPAWSTGGAARQGWRATGGAARQGSQATGGASRQGSRATGGASRQGSQATPAAPG